MAYVFDVAIFSRMVSEHHGAVKELNVEVMSELVWSRLRIYRFEDYRFANQNVRPWCYAPSSKMKSSPNPKAISPPLTIFATSSGNVALSISARLSALSLGDMRSTAAIC